MPGPGTNDPQYPVEAPQWSFGKPPQQKRNKDEAMADLGPGTHNPVHVTHTSKKAAFPMASKSGKGPAVDDGTELSAKIRNVQKKQRDQVQYLGVPGPQYDIPGDFDFPDPRNPDDTKGKKKAKFAFGMKFNTRAKNLDMPGPGEYETDVAPMNMKNIAYWIGTDVRKDLGVPYA